MPKFRLFALLLLLALVSLAACNDDDDCPTCPPESPEPTLDNLWPLADGTDWVYDFQFNEKEWSTDTGDTLPGFAALRQALLNPAPGTVVSQDEGLYRQYWNGQVTTDSGVVAKNMEVIIYGEVSGEVRGRNPDGLLELIARARGDLRPAIEGRLGRSLTHKSLDEAGDMFFLSPYAFAYEDSGYFGYGDLNGLHTWTYLTDDLAPGDGFTQQLVPGLADDIWLYGRVWNVGEFSVGNTVYSNAVECLYAIDLGFQQAMDAYGDIITEGYSYMYGRTVFVPEVGPVYCQERRVFPPDTQERGVSDHLVFSYECRLVR